MGKITQSDIFAALLFAVMKIKDEPDGASPTIKHLGEREIRTCLIKDYGDDRYDWDQALFVKWNSNYEVHTDAVFLDLLNPKQGWISVTHLVEYITNNYKQLPK